MERPGPPSGSGLCASAIKKGIKPAIDAWSALLDLHCVPPGYRCAEQGPKGEPHVLPPAASWSLAWPYDAPPRAPVPFGLARGTSPAETKREILLSVRKDS